MLALLRSPIHCVTYTLGCCPAQHWRYHKTHPLQRSTCLQGSLLFLPWAIILMSSKATRYLMWRKCTRVISKSLCLNEMKWNTRNYELPLYAYRPRTPGPSCTKRYKPYDCHEPVLKYWSTIILAPRQRCAWSWLYADASSCLQLSPLWLPPVSPSLELLVNSP